MITEVILCACVQLWFCSVRSCRFRSDSTPGWLNFTVPARASTARRHATSAGRTCSASWPPCWSSSAQSCHTTSTSTTTTTSKTVTRWSPQPPLPAAAPSDWLPDFTHSPPHPLHTTLRVYPAQYSENEINEIKLKYCIIHPTSRRDSQCSHILISIPKRHIIN